MQSLYAADDQVASYDYHLPPELIAERPLAERSRCRLLVCEVQRAQAVESVFEDILQLLPPDQLLVFNQSRVVPTRLRGHKLSGGAAECLILEPFAECPQALIKCRGPKRSGDRFVWGGQESEIVEVLPGGVFRLRFEAPLGPLLERHGLMPIPPYIRGGVSDEQDLEDYQTVYAQRPGSVAAPTAGLHFDEALLGRLRERGQPMAFITLHVGAGTFKPVAAERVADHRMHREFFEIDNKAQELIEAHWGRICAVGTTSLRALEASADERGQFRPSSGQQSTSIFIHPGVPIFSSTELITNFHLPRSSLMMLVSAFSGRERVLGWYRQAVEASFRFYSYGDAMLLRRGP